MGPRLPLSRADGLENRFVDPLDQVVAALIEFVDVPLGGSDLMVVLHAGFVFFVPELDVRLGEPGDEGTDRVVHEIAEPGDTGGKTDRSGRVESERGYHSEPEHVVLPQRAPRDRRLVSVTLPPAPRILVVMMSAVGDAIHALPVVTALKRRDPAAVVTWVLQPGPASLITGHPDVDEVVLFERNRGWRGFGGVRRQLSGRTFDLVLDLQVYFKASVVTALARAPIKLGFDRARARDLNWLVTTHRIPPHPPQHVQDQYFEFLDYLGVPARPVEWKLGPWADEREWQRRFFARFDRPAAALVIGSSDPHREWLPDRWAALADRLYEEFGLQPVLIGGRSPRELETERQILGGVRCPVISTLGISLRELVGVLDGTDLVIALNTAPLHMAVALDRPVISLMGHWNPKRTGPYRRFHDLMIDAYGEPEEDYAISTEKRPGGMQRIRVEDVLGKVRRWRDRYATPERRSPRAAE
jgi:heptosyltransferase I